MAKPTIPQLKPTIPQLKPTIPQLKCYGGRYSREWATSAGS
jgi:hypothetical protein